MSSKTGRVVVALCALAALGGLVVYAVVSGGAGAAAQALPDVGEFKVGSALGEERAGFSGRAMVQVFATAEAPEWPAISACLQSAEVEAEMVAFVGVLVDPRVEPGVEARFREKHGLQVIVRGLNGAYLGGLKAGFQCGDLVNLLKAVRSGMNPEIEKSPIYALLLRSPEVIDYYKARGEKAKVARFVDLLKEFEGSGSSAVLAAEARLSQ